MIKLRKRGVILIGVFLLLSSVFTGCGNQENPSDKKEVSNSKTSDGPGNSTQPEKVQEKKNID